MKNFYPTLLHKKGRSFLIAFSMLAAGAFTQQTNAAITGNPDVFLVRKNQSTSFNVGSNDTGCTGTPTFATTPGFTTRGTYSFAVPTSGNMTYTPPTDVVGIDSMKYQVTCSTGGSATPKVYALIIDDINTHQYYACSGKILLSMFPLDTELCRYSVYSSETGGTAITSNQPIPLISNPASGATYWVETQFNTARPTRPVNWVALPRVAVTLGTVSIGSNVICNATTATGCTATGRLLAKQDFGTGTAEVATTSSLPAGSTTYDFVSNKQPGDGEYSLVKVSTDPTYPAWIKNYTDHTGNGYMMMVNADDSGDKFYSLTIDNLCSNIQLTFSAWIGNLVNLNGYAGKANPNLRFDVRAGGPNGELVAQYYTDSIPKVRGDAVNKWKQYGFNFTNGTSSSLYFAIYNLETNTNGNDLVLDDIAVHLCIPPTTVSGQQVYCPNDPMNLTASYTDDGTFGQDYEIHWLYSANATAPLASWQLTSVTGATNNSAALAGYYRAVIGKAGNFNGDYNCCSISDPIQITVTPPLMYWKRTTGNKNWNDPANWEDVDGASLNAVPSACTDVHIPGNAAYYPSLYPDTTIRNTTYGEPVCRDIYFHFGSEVARTDTLTYRHAYIQYNFGYTPATVNGDIATTGNGSYSAALMKRGRWYVLSAPLKKIASGDFSVGGFPNMWQQSFKSSPKENGATGEWYTPKNTNSWDIGTQYNAISVWAGDHLAELGEDIHTNLDALKGIFEMPYFENTTINPFHRIHSYSGGVSSFQYYYYKVVGLPLAGTGGYPAYPAGTLARGSESYRFIFEGSLEDVGAVKAYKLSVPAGTDVMVGNPYLSSFSFSKFYAMNSTNIENYYRLFEETVPNSYSFTLGQQDLIASFQGFFIKTKGTGTVDLYFPVTSSVTRGQNIAHQLRSASKGGLKENVLQLTASNAKANSNVLLSLNSGLVGSNALQLFMNDPSSTSSLQFYVKSRDGMKNAIQYEDRDEVELNLGIVSESKEPATITISNVENVDAASLSLTDLKTNKTVNLFETSSYEFVNDPDFKGERFVLKASKLKAPTGIETAANETFNVSVSAQTLSVQSSGSISEVSVTSAQGQRIYDTQSINSHYFTREVQAAPGVYIVSVKLENGEVKNAKVIIR